MVFGLVIVVKRGYCERGIKGIFHNIDLRSSHAGFSIAHLAQCDLATKNPVDTGGISEHDRRARQRDRQHDGQGLGPGSWSKTAPSGDKRVGQSSATALP